MREEKDVKPTNPMTIKKLSRFKTPSGKVRFDVTVVTDETEAIIRGATSRQINTPRLLIDLICRQHTRVVIGDERFDDRIKGITSRAMDLFWKMSPKERNEMMQNVTWDPEGPSDALQVRPSLPKRKR